MDNRQTDDRQVDDHQTDIRLILKCKIFRHCKKIRHCKIFRQWITYPQVIHSPKKITFLLLYKSTEVFFELFEKPKEQISVKISLDFLDKLLTIPSKNLS